ncbi:MAG TPA: M48 family metallopeptidase [Terriglobales bacterium]|jgi:beta-barrel assembly-enhancing protease|nr:M48 family metallopeptidase [Terriglobales bacterium]
MKFRLLPGVVALSALLLASSAVAQQSSKDTKDQQTPSIQQTAPDQKPETPAEQQSPSAKPTLRRNPADTSAQTTSDPTAKPAPDTNSKDDGKKDDSSQADDAAKKDPPKVVAQPDDSKVKHDGSKNDVNAIGNRKVGGRGLGDWYSLEGEIRMGKQYAQEVEATSKLIRDPVITEYVNRIGQNLVRNSDAQVPFTIKVVDSDEVNAFALPGGFFYVNTGLILAADEESELAGVMAHEIAHVAARHSTRQMTRAQWMNIGTIPLIFVGGGIGYAVRSAAGLAIPMGFLAFSRSFESEADYLGLQYMYKAGYDPNAYVAFFEKLQAREKKKAGTLARAFSTHPQTPDRITKSQEEISRILPARQQYIVTTSEFADVKARLASVENRRKMVDDKGGTKPSLRRTSTADKTSDKNGDKGGDDDRPTLHRRDD